MVSKRSKSGKELWMLPAHKHWPAAMYPCSILSPEEAAAISVKGLAELMIAP
jgi:hypothetical protein